MSPGRVIIRVDDAHSENKASLAGASPYKQREAFSWVHNCITTSPTQAGLQALLLALSITVDEQLKKLFLFVLVI